jgi:hypothetical protein
LVTTGGSAANINVDRTIMAGGELEDSYYVLRPPVVQTQKPGVFENHVHLTVAGKVVIKPQCIIKFKGGDCEKGDKKKKKKRGGRKVGGKKRRRLSDDLYPDEVDEFEDQGMTEHAQQHEPLRQKLQEFGIDIDLERGEDWDHPLLDAMHPSGREREYREQEQRERKKSKERWEREQEGVFGTSESERRRLMEEDDEPWADDDQASSQCMETGRMPLGDPVEVVFFMTFYLLQPPFPMPPIKITIEVIGTMGLSVEVSLCIYDRKVSAALIPNFSVTCSLKAGISTGLAEGGIGIEAVLMNVDLIPTLSMQLKNTGGIRVCFQLDMEILPLVVNVFVYVQLLLCVEFSDDVIPIPEIVLCDEQRIVMFTFALDKIIINVIPKICNIALDDTPPFVDKAIVTASQEDKESIVMEWSGYQEDNTKVGGQ